MDVLARLDEARAAISVLEHPFYQRWSAGELSARELGCYAEEYRHAVNALARASELAAERSGPAHEPELRAHAEEEAAHVELWERFASAAGARPPGAVGTQALEQTRECVQAWTEGKDLLEHLAVLYAIEASQPEVSRTKIEGLTAHYGYGDEGSAVDYFKVHERQDREHARQVRELIAQLMAQVESGGEVAERMLSAARRALCGNWLLLDGVEAVTGGAKARVSV